MTVRPNSLRIGMVCLLPAHLLLYGCTTLGYYAQSINGHMEVLMQRQPIEDMLRTGNSQENIGRKLATVLELLEFAREEMLLPDNGSYRSYSDINRDYVIWNVFATPRLSLQPKEWCYLVVGCLGYRGYYSREDAVVYANKLKDEGYDVYLGGVAAYSTLGWFSDPVLNTMLRHDDTYLARIIFHELAHQKLYIKDDTEFNEAFADAVANIATRRWLERTRTTDEYQKFLRQERYDQEFTELVLSYRKKLQHLYASHHPDANKLAGKKRILAELVERYREISAHWLDYNVYDSWIGTDLNNARLAAFATYRELVPAFLALYEAVNEDPGNFYTRVGALSRCSYQDRRKYIKSPQYADEC
ncbi:MAG: aminopeptidase [Gammaproteobacteria bacterium]|nr:aminopeptidase [Gammaproteobacteria bacterium]